jgi:hypothetical protein
VRPHIQEGYLLAEYPEMTGIDQKQHYRHYEIDFGRRLIAKFKFKPRTFWPASSNFRKLPDGALYPEHDPLLVLVKTIRNDLKGSH